MSKQERAKAVFGKRCHNSIRECTNVCEPGYNFCNECRGLLGMTSQKKRHVVAKKYTYPLIGVGEAAQTHLNATELEEIRKARKPGTKEEKVMSLDQKDKVMNAKKSASMKERSADKPRTGVMFDGWLKDWIEASAAARGVSLRQYVLSVIMEHVPAEAVKAGLLAEMEGRKKGE